MAQVIRTGLFSSKALKVVKSFSDHIALNERDDIMKNRNAFDFNALCVVIQDSSNEVVLAKMPTVSDFRYECTFNDVSRSLSSYIRYFAKCMLKFIESKCKDDFGTSFQECLDRRISLSDFDNDECIDKDACVRISVKDIACCACLMLGRKLPHGVSSEYAASMKGIPLDPVSYEIVETLTSELADARASFESRIDKAYSDCRDAVDSIRVKYDDLVASLAHRWLAKKKIADDEFADAKRQLQVQRIEETSNMQKHRDQKLRDLKMEMDRRCKELSKQIAAARARKPVQMS